jgi:hypothetical protein
MDVGNADIGETVRFQHMKEPVQDAQALVLVVVLEIVRTVHGVELSRGECIEFPGVADDIRVACRIDVKEQMVPAGVVARDRNRLVVATDIEHPRGSGPRWPCHRIRFGRLFLGHHLAQDFCQQHRRFPSMAVVQALHRKAEQLQLFSGRHILECERSHLEVLL